MNAIVELFNVDQAAVPKNLQHGIIGLESYKAPLLKFYKLCVRLVDFHIMRRHELKSPSLFGDNTAVNSAQTQFWMYVFSLFA